MLRRSHYIAVGAVVLLTLVIMNLRGPMAARLKLGIGSLFLPLFGLASSTQHLAGQTRDALLPRSELLRQIDALRRENQQLRLQTTQAEAVALENDRLRKALVRQPLKRWKPKMAKVVLHEPANWWRTVQIDLGARDGLSNNLPVLTPEGFLAGRVAAVSLTRSQVVLLGDPNCSVSARIENETRDTGIIGAAGPLDAQVVEMGYLSRNANLKPGQNVRTSGNGGVFPENIPIGKVLDARVGEDLLSPTARVKLGANLNALEEVWVVFP